MPSTPSPQMKLNEKYLKLFWILKHVLVLLSSDLYQFINIIILLNIRAWNYTAFLFMVCMILCGLVWFTIFYHANLCPCKVSNGLTQLSPIFVLVFLRLLLWNSTNRFSSNRLNMLSMTMIFQLSVRYQRAEL